MPPKKKYLEILKPLISFDVLLSFFDYYYYHYNYWIVIHTLFIIYVSSILFASQCKFSLHYLECVWKYIIYTFIIVNPQHCFCV